MVFCRNFDAEKLLLFHAKNSFLKNLRGEQTLPKRAQKQNWFWICRAQARSPKVWTQRDFALRKRLTAFPQACLPDNKVSHVVD